jgi:hypothetical protein
LSGPFTAFFVVVGTFFDTSLDEDGDRSVGEFGAEIGVVLVEAFRDFFAAFDFADF